MHDLVCVCLIENAANPPYLFNIDRLLDHEPLPSNQIFTFPSPGAMPWSSSSSSLAAASLTSAFPRDEKSKGRLDTDTTPRSQSSSSFVRETKHLLEMISPTYDLTLSRVDSV